MYEFEFEKKKRLEAQQAKENPTPKKENSDTLDPFIPKTYSVAGPKFGDSKVVKVLPGGRIVVFSGWS